MSRSSKSNQKQETAADYLRVPGLFRKWELGDVLKAGSFYRLEKASELLDGTPVYFIYQRRETGQAA